MFQENLHPFFVDKYQLDKYQIRSSWDIEKINEMLNLLQTIQLNQFSFKGIKP